MGKKNKSKDASPEKANNGAIDVSKKVSRIVRKLLIIKTCVNSLN